MNRLREVDLAPFKAAFRETGLSFHEIGRRMNRHESMVARLLGTRQYAIRLKAGKAYRSGHATCTYETAVRLCDALDLDPVDMGL